MTPEARVRASFERQRYMRELGAELVRVASGEVDIRLPYDERLTQQHGFVHAGAVTSILDSACGYAALTQMREGDAVLTVELKLNLLEPVDGDVVARGRIVRAGRTLTVCEGSAFLDDGRRAATGLVTLIATRGGELTD